MKNSISISNNVNSIINTYKCLFFFKLLLRIFDVIIRFIKTVWKLKGSKICSVRNILISLIFVCDSVNSARNRLFFAHFFAQKLMVYEFLKYIRPDSMVFQNIFHLHDFIQYILMLRSLKMKFLQKSASTKIYLQVPLFLKIIPSEFAF